MSLVPEQGPPAREDIERHVAASVHAHAPVEPSGRSEGAFELGAPLGNTPGDVYETRHPRLAGRFAIKLLRRARGAPAEAIDQFRTDVERMAGLRHPNVAEVIELGAIADGTPIVVSERLQGQTLAERLAVRREPMPPSEVVPIVREVAKALEAAHRAGVVHGEIRPDNIFLAEIAGYENGFVKLLDFGVVHLEQGEAGRALRRMDVERARYLSPEQVHLFIGDVRAGEVDWRSDQFSLAAVSYRLITGREAFEGDELALVMERVASGAPRPMTEVVACDPRVAAVVAKALERDQRDRFESVLAFANALEHAAAAEMPTFKPTPVMQPTGQINEPRPRALTPDAPLAADSDWESSPPPAPVVYQEVVPAPAPVRRKDSLSAVFFEEGERKEQGQWSAQDLEQFEEDDVPDREAELEDEFDEFRLPRQRRMWPWLLASAVVAGAVVWWSGWRPSVLWTPSYRNAAPVATTETGAAPVAAPVPAAGTPAPVPVAPAAPAAPAAQAVPAAPPVAAPVPAAPPVAAPVPAAPPVAAPAASAPAAPAAPAAAPAAVPAVPPPAATAQPQQPPVQIVNPRPGRPWRRDAPPLRGYVWSPREQRMVPSGQ